MILAGSRTDFDRSVLVPKAVGENLPFCLNFAKLRGCFWRNSAKNTDYVGNGGNLRGWGGHLSGRTHHIRHCEERSDEAIQCWRSATLDCFASLAMTMGD